MTQKSIGTAGVTRTEDVIVNSATVTVVADLYELGVRSKDARVEGKRKGTDVIMRR